MRVWPRANAWQTNRVSDIWHDADLVSHLTENTEAKRGPQGTGRQNRSTCSARSRARLVRDAVVGDVDAMHREGLGLRVEVPRARARVQTGIAVEIEIEIEIYYRDRDII